MRVEKKKILYSDSCMEDKNITYRDTIERENFFVDGEALTFPNFTCNGFSQNFVK